MNPQSALVELSHERIEKSIKKIPALSQVVMELNAALMDNDLSMNTIVNLLAKDQVLASKVLRMANSPFFGLSRKVASIREAATILGVHAIHNMTLSMDVIGRFSSGGSSRFDRGKFWQHSIGTALASRVVAHECGLEHEAAFTAGLLHDIGRVILDVFFSEYFESVLRWQREQGALIYQAEKHILNLDHTSIGMIVAGHWKLPESIRNAIQYHHRPNSVAATLFANVVHVGDFVCRALDIGNGGDPFVPGLEKKALDRLGLEIEQLSGIMAKTEQENLCSNIFLGA